MIGIRDHIFTIKEDAKPFLVLAGMPFLCHGPTATLCIEITEQRHAYIRIWDSGHQSPDAFPGKTHFMFQISGTRCVVYPHTTPLPCTRCSEMLLFPTTTVDIPDDWSNIKSNSYIRSFPADSACHGNTGRSILVNDTAMRYPCVIC